MGERACVYTCLTGGYEALNEQPVAAASGLDFICFTDNPSLVSKSWRTVRVEPALPFDPVRSQRILKLSPHEFLPGYDISLYIDNSVILKVPPEEVIARYLPAPARAAIPGHSFRASVRDEFLEILRLGYDDGSRILEQLNHYQLTAPQVLADVPFWSAVMIRRHHDPTVIAAMRLWLTHVLRYSRRDQVSGTLAFRSAGLEVARFEIDNLESWFHRWPVSSGRNRSTLPFAPGLSQLPAPLLVEAWQRSQAEQTGRIAELEQQLGDARTQTDALRAELQSRPLPAVEHASGGPAADLPKGRLARLARALSARRRRA